MGKVFEWLDRSPGEPIAAYDKRINALAAFHAGYAFFSWENYHEEIGAFTMYAVWNGELNAKLVNPLPSGGFMLHCSREKAEDFLSYGDGYPVFLRLRSKLGRLYVGSMLLSDRESLYDFYYNGCEVVPPQMVCFRPYQTPEDPHYNEPRELSSGSPEVSGSYRAQRGGSYAHGSYMRGSYRGGSYRYGSFLGSGRWSGGSYAGGSYRSGLWQRGSYIGGSYRYGLWQGGSYLGGSYRSWLWQRGSYIGGSYRYGLWQGGSYLGGSYRYGLWQGGSYLGGSYRYGLWQGGSYLGGSYRYGLWQGGSYHAGSYLGGQLYNGSYYGGSYQRGSYVYGGCADLFFLCEDTRYTEEQPEPMDDSGALLGFPVRRLIEEMGYGLDLI